MEHVQTAEKVDRGVNRFFYAFGIGDVRLYYNGFSAERFYLLRNPAEPFPISCNQGDVRSFPCHAQRGRLSYPA